MVHTRVADPLSHNTDGKETASITMFTQVLSQPQLNTTHHNVAQLPFEFIVLTQQEIILVL